MNGKKKKCHRNKFEFYLIDVCRKIKAIKKQEESRRKVNRKSFQQEDLNELKSTVEI